MTILKLYSQGPEVKSMQEKLQRLGYTLTPDGNFGPNTDRVVRQFQAAQGLAVDGIVGNDTMNAIDASLAAQKVYGIDISHFNGSIDWNAISRNDVLFVICKATQGSSLKDPKFSDNIKALKDAGMIRGAYHFFVFEGATAQQQIDNFLSFGIDYSTPGTLPPCVDIESQVAVRAADDYVRNNQSTCVQMIHDWLTGIENATGRKPVIYTLKSYWNDFLGNPAGFESYPLWVASYRPVSPVMPGNWADFTFWQFTDKGSLTGITGNVDRNIFNGNLDDLNKIALI